MRYLAKVGFSQSYTYFTWRNTKAELTEYFTELTQTDVREYMRPNLFANTPDILHEYLQHGGRPAFQVRLVLAATLGASYGIYSGFELVENVPVQPGSEEYLDSEKYQIRPRDFDAAGSLARADRAGSTRSAASTRRCSTTAGSRSTRPTTPQLICYSKRSPDGRDLVLVVVNLDPHHMQHGFVQLPLADWGLTPHATDRGRSTCCPASATSGAANGTTCGSTRRTASRTSCTSCDVSHPDPSRMTRRDRRHAPMPNDPPLVQGRRHLPGARPRLLRQQQRRHRRLPPA